MCSTGSAATYAVAYPIAYVIEYVIEYAIFPRRGTATVIETEKSDVTSRVLRAYSKQKDRVINVRC